VWTGRASGACGSATCAPASDSPVWNRLIAEPYQSGIGSTAEANRFILRETLREVAQQPVAWLGIMLAKARELVSGAEIPRNTSIYPDRKHSRVLRVLLWNHGLAFPSGLIIPFGLAGIWLARRSWRTHFVPLSLLAVQALFVLAFFVTARYRLPSLPLLSLYAAHAGLTLLALARERRRAEAARLAGLLALLLFVSNHAVGAMPASHWPLEHPDLARTLIARHELRQGEAQLRAALAQDPDFSAANDQLCALLIYADRAPEAVSSCTRAVASQPESADLHYQLGVALEASGRRPAAIAEYRMALPARPRNSALRRGPCEGPRPLATSTSAATPSWISRLHARGDLLAQCRAQLEACGACELRGFFTP